MQKSSLSPAKKISWGETILNSLVISLLLTTEEYSKSFELLILYLEKHLIYLYATFVTPKYISVLTFTSNSKVI